MNTFLELSESEQESARGGIDPASAALITFVGLFVTNWTQIKTGFADGVLAGYNAVQ
ncbi:MAG TPA: hypothetical protein VGM73_00960 [Candidatus Didemnitutus sp.]|jgi:hypothetical protein